MREPSKDLTSGIGCGLGIGALPFCDLGQLTILEHIVGTTTQFSGL